MSTPQPMKRTTQAVSKPSINRNAIENHVQPYTQRSVSKGLPATRKTTPVISLEDPEMELAPEKPTPKPALTFVKSPPLSSHPTMKGPKPIDVELVALQLKMTELGWEDLDTIKRKVSCSPKNPNREYWHHEATGTWLGWVNEPNAPLPNPWEPIHPEIVPHLEEYGWGHKPVSQMFQRLGLKDKPNCYGLYLKLGPNFNNCESMGSWNPEDTNPETQLDLKFYPVMASLQEIMALNDIGWPLGGKTLFKIRSGSKAKRPGAEGFWIRDKYSNPKNAVFACYVDQVYPPSKKTLVNLEELDK